MIQRFIASCHICQQSKIFKETYNELLKPLPVLKWRWKNIIVDFVIELPSFNSYTNIMIVVECLTKMRHLILCFNIIVSSVAQLFLINVWKLHNLSDLIVFDKEMQFISAFWDKLTKCLQIKAHLFTTFHSESDD